MARRQEMEEKIPAFTPWNLRAGIRAHCEYGWEENLRMEFYHDLEERQKGGLTKGWWEGIVDVLSGWGALRPTLSKDDACHRGAKQRLNRLSKEVGEMRDGCKVCIESCEWKDVAGLFNVAHEIKGVQSPVFASKLCHFILPAAFPVFDNAALRLVNHPTEEDYQEYWECLRGRWLKCGCKRELKDMLRPHIGCKNPAGYPWASKIAGLVATKPPR